MSVVVFFLIGVYILLSIGFVKLVGRFTKGKKLYKYLAIAACILLPTWDIVLGMIVYFPACLFVPKVAIYETAETEGIYYEGMHDYIFQPDHNTEKRPDYDLVSVGWLYEGIKKDFRFVESKSDQKASFIYRCSKSENNLTGKKILADVAICTVVDQPMSRYMVKVTEIKIGTGGIQTKQIFDRATGKLMALYRQATLDPFFPFFNWLYQADGGGKILNCFGSDRYYYFEYEILKPIKK
ncbi:MAG: hypothetical protein A4E62_00337 [Syntrophorhabdus sp. PtaU1.Bin002]|nr:MAG: hypothetical protein A4E62_00337 [Syntrophorhabdus sp. PtaU1.Bin002]